MLDSRHAAGCSIHLAHRYFGAFGRWNLWLAVAHLRLNCFRLVGLARVLRYRYEYSRERDYVRAAKFMGVKPFTVMIRHLIP